MKRKTFLFGAIFTALLSANAFSQVDEVSDATGLPIPIGAPVIYGQVTVEGVPRGQQKPTIWVYLLNGGAQLDKRRTNNGDYYYFLQAPRNGYTIMIEANGKEVGRATLTSGISNRVRQDLAINWMALAGGEPQTLLGTISAGIGHERTKENQSTFDHAMKSIKDGKHSAAIKLFDAVIAADPEDFVSLMMVGTVYMTDKKHDEARQAFERSLKLKPNYLLALLNYGKLELGLKNFPKAEELCMRAVTADPSSAEANHYLGETYLQAKRGSLAVGYLNKAIELAPIEKADIHLRLGALYDGAGMKDKAVAEYKAFLEKVTDYKDAQRLRKYIADNSN